MTVIEHTIGQSNILPLGLHSVALDDFEDNVGFER